MGYLIRGTKEGLWYEVVFCQESSGDPMKDGVVVSEFELDYSKERGRLVIKKLLFKGDLDKKQKEEILHAIEDFVESLNAW